MKTQKQMFYDAHNKLADVDKTFMEMLKGDHPITNSELERLIKLRPSVWSRYSGFIGKLND